jgi:enoyl-CoA hydratase
MTTAALSVEVTEPGVVTLTLQRPQRRNALSGDLLGEMHRAVDRLVADPSLRVLVITGAGDAFCSGADLKGSGDLDAEATAGSPAGNLLPSVSNATVRTFLAQEHMASLFEKLHRMRLPVIAAVNGPAVGGGFALALACDIRIASTAATFGAIFISRGVSACDMGTSYFLPRLVGASRAAELMLTGRVFDVAEAERIGLVTDVVAPDELLPRALAQARMVARNSPLAVWMTKETMWQTIDSPSLRHALDMENRTQIMCTATGELDEAFRAFREKRTAQWSAL